MNDPRFPSRKGQPVTLPYLLTNNVLVPGMVEIDCQVCGTKLYEQPKNISNIWSKGGSVLCGSCAYPRLKLRPGKLGIDMYQEGGAQDPRLKAMAEAVLKDLNRKPQG